MNLGFTKSFLRDRYVFILTNLLFCLMLCGDKLEKSLKIETGQGQCTNQRKNKKIALKLLVGKTLLKDVLLIYCPTFVK